MCAALRDNFVHRQQRATADDADMHTHTCAAAARMTTCIGVVLTGLHAEADMPQTYVGRTDPGVQGSAQALSNAPP
jgi:hypothetical protein